MTSTHWRDRHKVIPAVYVLLRRDDKILFLKRQNTGYRDGYYSLPAGHVDGREPAVAAAIREVKEEAGVTVKEEDLRLVHVQHRIAEGGDHERMNLFFETTVWEGEPTNAEPDKCSEILWENPEHPPENIVMELEHLFKHLKNNSSYGHFDFD